MKDINDTKSIMHEMNNQEKTYNGSNINLRRKWIISSGKKGVIKKINFAVIPRTKYEVSINTPPGNVLQESRVLTSQTGIFMFLI